MRRVHESAEHGICCFLPELLDVRVPLGQKEATFTDLFLVMEYEQTDLRKLLKLGERSKL